MNKNILISSLIALIVSVSSISLYDRFAEDGKTVKIQHINSTPSTSAVYSINNKNELIPLDFHEPATKVLDGVVHIKSTHVYSGNTRQNQFRNVPDPFRDFFGEEFDQFFGPRFRFEAPNSPQYPNQAPAKIGTGSGVIISEDGYIVTNHHVISEADDIEVTLHDNRTYKAAVIGVDPSTDLALLQIKEKNLTTVPFVDSDEVRVGQWVLAVGNPLGLNSSVTAGIVSAKGRNINILKDKYAVENFIQTDAAINPGNSGGALVSLDGGLVGINTAIASPTGTFAGYGFAIPANIVQKVVQDLLEYGVVQRGVLGVMIRTLDGNLAKDKDLERTQGVYVDSLLENSAAGKAGVKVGDIIVAVNGIDVSSSPELQGMIARFRPGEEVQLNINRAGKEKSIKVILNNRAGTTDITRADNREILKVLGAEFEEIDSKTARKLDITAGIKVKKLHAGKLRKYTQMRDGFIITKVDGRSIDSLDEFIEILDSKEGGIMLEGVYEDIPGIYYYAFGLNS